MKWRWLVLFLIASGAAIFLWGTRSHIGRIHTSPPPVQPISSASVDAAVPSASPAAPPVTLRPLTATQSTDTASAVPPAVASVLASPPSAAVAAKEEPSAAPAATESALETLRVAVRSYGSRFGGNPVGNNAEITRALTGDNPKHVRFLDDARLNDRGELVDGWGTPYFFHQLSGQETEIRSAGPDRQMWTSDDIVLR